MQVPSVWHVDPFWMAPGQAGEEPSHPKRSVERAKGTSSQLLPSPVGAQELFWRVMLELHGRRPLLTSAVRAPSASVLRKKRMCERLPTSARRHSSNLAIVYLIEEPIMDVYIFMDVHTHLYLLSPKFCPDCHIYLRIVGLFYDCCFPLKPLALVCPAVVFDWTSSSKGRSGIETCNYLDKR